MPMPPVSALVRGYIIAALGLLAAGCAAGGRIGNLPPVSRPDEAGTLTLYRDGSWTGFPGQIIAGIDGRDLFRLGRDEAYTVTLDPDQYLIAYRIGFNECRRLVLIKPRQNHRLRLAPNCSVFGSID